MTDLTHLLVFTTASCGTGPLILATRRCGPSMPGISLCNRLMAVPAESATARCTGPCDTCGTMGSRKWVAGPNGRGCLCTTCVEGGEEPYNWRRGLGEGLTVRRDTWALETSNDCTVLIHAALAGRFTRKGGLVSSMSRVAVLSPSCVHEGCPWTCRRRSSMPACTR